MSVESEYDRVFYEAGIANRELHVLDDALDALKWQRKALQAAVHAKNHAFTEFILAHGDEVREITEQRAAEKRATNDTTARPIEGSARGLPSNR